MTSVFKLIFKHIEGLIKFFSFQVLIRSGQSLIINLVLTLKNLNARNKAKFDFSTLCTNIPHYKLIRVLNEYIDLKLVMGSSL